MVSTHLKNISQNGWKSSPIFGVKIPTIFELPPPRKKFPSYFLGGTTNSQEVTILPSTGLPRNASKVRAALGWDRLSMTGIFVLLGRINGLPSGKLTWQAKEIRNLNWVKMIFPIENGGDFPWLCSYKWRIFRGLVMWVYQRVCFNPSIIWCGL